ncbi:bile acid:sodium symporter family protein [Glycocaulis sp.]|uniref:bile acid:sodium symporter family protein n=1 Tax=Glycocaulis sp. TaxID=1969725 RepID=UPI003F70312A
MDSFIGQILLPLALAFIMLALGVGLTPGDFRRIFTKPKALLVGAVLQYISLPLLAIAIVAFLPAPPVLKVGIVLLAACPGGTTSNLLTHMARGDVALSISLTALTSLTSMFTVPVVLMIALALFMGPEAPSVGLVTTGLVIFLLTVVPVGIGMTIRQFAPKVANVLDRHSRLLSGIVFTAVVLATLIADRDELVARFAEAGLIALSLNVAAMLVAFSVASLVMLKMKQRIALTLECGLQNATLAIVVSVSMLGSVSYAVPAAIYGLLMFLTAGAFILWARRWSGVASRARRFSAGA